MAIPRRSLLAAMAAASAAPGSVPAATEARLPVIRLGEFEVTRLIASYNPIGGYSHSVPKLSAIMRNWFTAERTRDFLLSCERNGINTWQASYDPKAFEALRAARERGSKMQWICLIPDVTAAQWKEIRDLKPIAVVHHGEQTDRYYKAGETAKIADFVRKVHDFGLLAGISSHTPEHIARSEDAGWGQDFYMTCFHNIRRDQDRLRASLGNDLPVDELYLQNDPGRMTDVVRQMKRPCLGFKILAAGRLAMNAASLERSFRYAFQRIKPTDGVIVGMFPILTDEVAENAALTRRILTVS